jgi:hypothetical protein
MSDELVHRLRLADADTKAIFGEDFVSTQGEAADEIERLRAEVAKLTADIEQGYMAGAYARLKNLQQAESALAALRKRVEEAVVAMVHCDYEGTIVTSKRYYDGSRMEGENFRLANAEQDAIDALHEKCVALVVLD